MEILSLYEASKPRVRELTRSQYAVQALDRIFARPVFKASDFVKQAGIPDATAKRIVSVLSKGGLLRPISPGRGRRAAILVFRELLNIAEGYAAF